MLYHHNHGASLEEIPEQVFQLELEPPGDQAKSIEFIGLPWTAQLSLIYCAGVAPILSPEMLGFVFSLLAF